MTISNWVIPLFVMLLYLAFALYIGLLAGKGRKASVAEFTVAERGLGPFIMWFLMGGSIFSAFAFLGGPGWAYAKGAPAFYILSYGAMGLIPWYFIGPKIARIGEKFNFFTQGDLLRERYKSRALPTLIALVAELAFLQYLALQIKGTAYVFNTLTAGHVPIWLAALIAYGIVVVYVATGGVRAAAWSDVLQAALMLIVAWIVGLYLPYHLYGGPGEMFRQIATKLPGHLVIGKAGSHMSRMAYSTAIILSIIGFTMWPHLFMKSYTTSERTIKKTTMLYPTFEIIMIPILFIGFAGILKVPFGTLKSPDQILPYMIATLKTSPWLIALIGAGALSAAMSTSDAVTHGAASTFVEDVIVTNNPNLTERQKIVFLRWTVVIFGAIAYLIAVFGGQSLVKLLLGGYGYIVQIAPPVYGALYWKRATRAGAIWGFVAGATLNGIYAFGHLKTPFGMNSGIVALILNIIVFVTVSYLTKPEPESHTRAFTEA